MARLTHIDERGSARMVAIDRKEVTRRRAVAVSSLKLQATTYELIKSGNTPKGDVFSTARIAGVMAAKETSRLIPLCHPLKITSVEIDFDYDEEKGQIGVTAVVEALDRTGVEMEALTAASISALTLYDMLKAVDQGLVIQETYLQEKTGGRHHISREVASELIPPPSPQPQVQPQNSLLGHSIRVIGKQPQAVENIQEVTVASFDSMEDDEALVSSCARPMLQLLTPVEPISAMNQVEGMESEAPEEESDQDQSVWDESVLTDYSNVEDSLKLNTSDAALELALQVREVALTYPPLQRFITKRPVECSYLLGYLSPESSKRSRAFILEEEELTVGPDGENHLKVRALLFVYSGLTLPTVWTYGSELDVEAILYAVRGELPRRAYLNMYDHHLQAVRTQYSLRNRREILRMGLHQEHYIPVGDTEGVVSLGHRDTGSIMSLFQRYYSDHLFEPAQLDLGLYCGIRGEQGALLSVAGLHLLNPVYRVAAIGNIVTDEQFRGLGYASRCVQHILDRLFEGVDHVALNVLEDNLPAIHCYRKFGFRTTSRLVEAQARLRR